MAGRWYTVESYSNWSEFGLQCRRWDYTLANEQRGGETSESGSTVLSGQGFAFHPE